MSKYNELVTKLRETAKIERMDKSEATTAPAATAPAKDGAKDAAKDAAAAAAAAAAKAGGAMAPAKK